MKAQLLHSCWESYKSRLTFGDSDLLAIAYNAFLAGIVANEEVTSILSEIENGNIIFTELTDAKTN